MNKEKAASMIDQLASSPQPSIRYKAKVNILDQDPLSRPIRDLKNKIKGSSLVRSLLKDHPESIYKKWAGAHWILTQLADLGYPGADPDIQPLRDQVLDGWLVPAYKHTIYFDETPTYSKMKKGVPVIRGRARRCASQQGNALYASLKLGFLDDRCHQLAEMLIHWQWPDGGWNCDKKAEAVHSSFWESLIPLRGLSLYKQITGDKKAGQAVEQGGEVFLQRNLYLRLSDGRVMNRQFTQLRYPNYWRYNILIGLLVMSEAGFLDDPRCNKALDLLESKQLPDGGWPAEDRFYQTTKPDLSGYSRVNWGGVSKHKMNPWVTVDALTVLQKAGRI